MLDWKGLSARPRSLHFFLRVMEVSEGDKEGVMWDIRLMFQRELWQLQCGKWIGDTGQGEQ